MCLENPMCLRRNQTGETELNETEQTGKNCCESGDESCYTPHFSAEVDLIGIFLAFLIVVLNNMAKKRSLRTTTNNFLIGLAASDLLEGLIGLPLVITCNIFMEHGVCFSTIYVWMFTSFLTMSHIMAVTADGFIAIMFALDILRSLPSVAAISLWGLSGPSHSCCHCFSYGGYSLQTTIPTRVFLNNI